MQSTTRIFEEFSIDGVPIVYADISIDLDMPETLSVSLEMIDGSLVRRIRRHGYFNHFKRSLKNRPMKISDLIGIFEALDYNQPLIEALPDKQIAIIEEYRQHVMLAVYKTIEQQGRPPASIRTIEEDEGVRLFNFLHKHTPGVLAAAFSVLFIVGMMLDLIYSFSGFYEIAAFIPGLAPSMLIGVCIALSLLNLLLYVTFEGVMMGEMFGIGLKSAEKKKLDAWASQLQLTKNIHERMTDQDIKTKMKQEETRQTYQAFDNLCDRHIFRRQLMFKDEDCNESKRAKVVRIITLVVGALLSMGNSCFGAISALPIVMSCIPFFAAAWFPPLFVTAVLTLGLAYYLFAQRKTIMMVLSINLDKKQEIAKELNEYHDRQPLEKTTKQDLIIKSDDESMELKTRCTDNDSITAVPSFTSESYSL